MDQIVMAIALWCTDFNDSIESIRCKQTLFNCYVKKTNYPGSPDGTTLTYCINRYIQNE
jgi:hypothetical protein